MNLSSRWLLIGLTVLALCGVGLSCGSGKSPSGCESTCASGCCDATGTCQLGTMTNACGTKGKACSACTGNQTCTLGTCGAANVGGGAGGGGGSGGGTGGGLGGGSGGGTGGGSGGGQGGGVGGGPGGGSGGGSGGAGGGATDAGLTVEQQAILTARPYRTVVPTGYDGGFAVPMVVLLHGYSATGLGQDLYFGFTALANAKTFVLATPDGKIDGTANHYWNATNACCDLYGAAPDDVKYLTAILDEAALNYRIDPKRVYFVGHSNGGFMSHRMACDLSDRVAAIVSLAGANWKDLSKCQPTSPVAVLEVHGTFDAVIAYDGGSNVGQAYPGAGETVQGWAQLNGCSGGLSVAGAPLDLDSNVFGSETIRTHYTCTAGAAELWTLEGSGHLPGLGIPTWGNEVWNFLSAHPKP